MQWAYAVISDPIPWLTMGLFMKASGTCAVFCSSTVNVCIVYAISSPTFLASIRLCFVSLVLPTGQTIRWDPCYAIYSLRFHSIRGNGDERSDTSIGSFLIWNRFPNFNATTRWKRREYSINNNSISTFPSPQSKLWARVDRWKSANWLTNPIRPAIGILGNE